MFSSCLKYFFFVLGALLIVVCVGNSIDEPTSSEAVNKPIPYQISGFDSCPLSEEDIDLLVSIEKGTVEPNISINDNERIALSPQEINTWRATRGLLKDYFPPSVIERDKAKPVFLAIFDGTWNDRKDLDEPLTVPAILSYELEKLAEKDKHLFVKYYYGVGTRVSPFEAFIEGVSGKGTAERAELALTELQKVVDEIGEMPHVYAIGFSRGAASARHFLNLVDPMFDLPSTISDITVNRSRSFALLFDTVATGQIDNLHLEIPTSAVSVLHLVATNERRLSFPYVTVLSNLNDGDDFNIILELELPGAHSNLGGGYGDGLEVISLDVARRWLVEQGFDLDSSELDALKVMNKGRHNSDWLFTSIGNGLLHLFGLQERRRIEPADISNKELTSEQELALLIEKSGLIISSAKASYERLLVKKENGQYIPDKYLSFNFSRDGEVLLISTNCPDYVSFEPKKRLLLLKDTDVFALHDMYRDLDTTLGFIKVIQAENPSNFRVKQEVTR